MNANLAENKNLETGGGLDPYLAKELHLLKINPKFDRERADIGRIHFLNQAYELGKNYSITVSKTPFWRLNKWKADFSYLFTQKEKKNMFMPIISILIAFSLLFGGGTFAVSAAQDSLPGQPLWMVKTITEETQLKFESDSAQVIQIQMRLIDRRMEEARRMIELGIEPPGELIQRMEKHMDRIMEEANKIEHKYLHQNLEQVRDSYEKQEMKFGVFLDGSSLSSVSSVTQIRLLLRERIRLMDSCLEDPLQLRDWVRLRDQIHQNESGNGLYRNGPNDGDGDSKSGEPYRVGADPNKQGNQPEDRSTDPLEKQNQYQYQNECMDLCQCQCQEQCPCDEGNKNQNQDRNMEQNQNQEHQNNNGTNPDNPGKAGDGQQMGNPGNDQNPDSNKTPSQPDPQDKSQSVQSQGGENGDNGSGSSQSTQKGNKP